MWGGDNLVTAAASPRVKTSGRDWNSPLGETVGGFGGPGSGLVGGERATMELESTSDISTKKNGKPFEYSQRALLWDIFDPCDKMSSWVCRDGEMREALSPKTVTDALAGRLSGAALFGEREIAVIRYCPMPVRVKGDV